jgi:hypothetical protein
MMDFWQSQNRRNCGCGKPADFVADNNEAGVAYPYCDTCEEKRAEKFGCALIIAEGATCEDGICGCGGTGVY